MRHEARMRCRNFLGWCFDLLTVMPMWWAEQKHARRMAARQRKG